MISVIPSTKVACRLPCGDVDWNSRPVCRRLKAIVVVSLAETWIEIVWIAVSIAANACRLPCGDVDWNSSKTKSICKPIWSSPLRRRGLKSFINLIVISLSSRLPCGDVDWNGYCERGTSLRIKSSPLRRRGLKFVLTTTSTRCSASRLPCGDVDWNLPLPIFQL